MHMQNRNASASLICKLCRRFLCLIVSIWSRLWYEKKNAHFHCYDGRYGRLTKRTALLTDKMINNNYKMLLFIHRMNIRYKWNCFLFSFFIFALPFYFTFIGLYKTKNIIADHQTNASGKFFTMLLRRSAQTAIGILVPVLHLSNWMEFNLKKTVKHTKKNRFQFKMSLIYLHNSNMQR